MSENSSSFEVASNGSKFQVTLKFRRWTDHQARLQGFKWGAACWIVAGVAVPIPIIHFIAVPAGLLAGPLVAYLVTKLYRGSFDIVEGKVPCAKCGTDNVGQVKLEQRLQSFNCNSCATVIELTRQT